MQISIGFSGPAGSGVNTAGLLLAEILAERGYTIYGDKEYASVIKGDNNCFFLYVSDKEEIFITKKINYFLAYDTYALEKNKNIYDLEDSFVLEHEKCTYKNTFAFGAAIKIFGISLEDGENILKKQLEKKGISQDKISKNFIDLENGYKYILNYGGENCNLINFNKTIGEKKNIMYGNELVAKGAIASGLEFYAAYPMTPASSIIDEIIKNNDVIFYQGEDEIAVSMAMLGAKYSGKRSMCGTSGGGFALMSESIAFSNQAEIGGVYILSQRDGPSTGTPTFTGQGDLNYALNPSFGDTTPIVFSPSTFEEVYSFVGKALNWSDQYQHPVIMLLDKQLSESYLSINARELVAEPIKRGEQAASSDQDTYKRYEITETGISPYAIPGEKNTTFIATSYEHDEYGFTNENPKIKKSMMEKRMKKMETFLKNEFNNDFYGYEIINPNAKKFYITMGINRYPIEQVSKSGKDIGIIIIKTFYPFDKRLKLFFDEKKERIESLIFVELNYSGILEELVRKECELYQDRNRKIRNIRKYELYPIFQEDLL